MKAVLTLPTHDLLPSFIEALREGYSGSTERLETEEDIERIASDPAEFLEKLLGPQPEWIELDDGSQAPRVGSTTLWLSSDSRFIGSINIRHKLTPNLEKFGGHIGYCIRPRDRRKGHAQHMLSQGIRYAKERLGLHALLLTCNDDNIASIRTIEANGGCLLDRTYHPFDAERLMRRYRIGSQ